MMDPERWRQIDVLLQAALDHPPAARAGFLLEACNGDEALEREVSSLLASHLAAGRFLESPAMDIAAATLSRDDDTSEVPGSLAGLTISHYRIIRKLGGGGM